MIFLCKKFTSEFAELMTNVALVSLGQLLILVCSHVVMVMFLSCDDVGEASPSNVMLM